MIRRYGEEDQVGRVPVSDTTEESHEVLLIFSV